MQIFFSLFVFGEVWRSKEKEVTLSSISINNKIMTYIETRNTPVVWIIEPKVFKVCTRLLYGGLEEGGV